MSIKKMEMEVQTLGKEHKRFLGAVEQKDFILVLLAFLIPFLSWTPVIGQILSGSPNLSVDPSSIWYLIQLLIPVILFVLAALSGGVTSSILISIAGTIGYLIVGVPYYWNPFGWDPLSATYPFYGLFPRPQYYPPLPSVVFADCNKLLLNLLLPGLIGGVLVEFGVIAAVKNDIKQLVHRPLALLILLAGLLGSVLVYDKASAATLTATNPVTYSFLLIGVLAIVAVVAFATGTAYGGFTVGFLISLVYYAVAAAKNPSTDVLGVFSLGISNWVLGTGLDLNLQSYYIAYGLGFMIAALWGSIWGVLGKYMIYVSPARKPQEVITEAHVFRDLWSNYFIFGKDTRPEFRLKSAAGSTVQGGASLTSVLGAKGAKAGYITYRYLDRKLRYETAQASVGGVIIEPTKNGKANVYQRVYSARGAESKQLVGEFYDPKPLFDRYSPVWSPFALALREYLAKIMNPIVLLPIIIGAIFFSPVILGAYGLVLSGKAPPAAGWIVVAQLAILLVVLGYLFLWRRKIPTALKAHPEGALAFVFAILIIGVLFIFSFYLLSALILVINSGNIDDLVAFRTNSIIFLLVVSIFTSFSTVQLLGAENFNIYFYDDADKDLVPYKHDYDKPQWLKGSRYWVFRHIYIWPYEATPSLRGFIHEDIERIEIWVNAETAKPEWSVSDYHWREIWYRIPELDEDVAIQANFSKDFHTPSVSVIRRSHLQEVKYTSESWFQSLEALLHYWRVSREITRQTQKPPKISKKRAETLQNFFVDLPLPVRLPAATTMASFAWNFFRYPQGVATAATTEGVTKFVYREKDYKPPFVEKIVGGNLAADANDGLGAPAVLDDKAPQLCPSCGKPLPKSLVCSSCKTDAKVESYLNIM